MVCVNRGVTAPSSAAMPSQVADRTNRLANRIPFISVDSKRLLIFNSYRFKFNYQSFVSIEAKKREIQSASGLCH
jgi:hypothetical protein